MSTETNKTVVRRYIEEVINQGNLDLIDEFFAPPMRERVRGFLSGGDDAFPDGHQEIQDIVAEGDKVMVRWIFRGTQLGTFMGLPPTGKPVEVIGYATYVLENGQIVWDTMSMEWTDALDQLGAVISPSRA